jgi:thiamine transport system permease protein
MLREVCPARFLVIFLICLTSFAVALTLGGGPRATTVELAIYQAFRFDFDLGRAALLALVQFGSAPSRRRWLARGGAVGVRRRARPAGGALGRGSAGCGLQDAARSLARRFPAGAAGAGRGAGLPHLAGCRIPVWRRRRSLAVALARRRWRWRWRWRWPGGRAAGGRRGAGCWRGSG